VSKEMRARRWDGLLKGEAGGDKGGPGFHLFLCRKASRRGQCGRHVCDGGCAERRRRRRELRWRVLLACL